MEKELIPIKQCEFNKIRKGCGIKYYCKIPDKELKAKLGYCPTKPRRKVEMKDGFGFCKEFPTLLQAAEYCKIPHYSAIKYALDQKNPSIKRRSDKKIFYVKEIYSLNKDYF